MQAVEILRRLVVALGDHDAEARQDLQMVGVAVVVALHPPLDVVVIGLGLGNVQMGRENRLRQFRSKFPPLVGGAGLHLHRIALNGTGHVEGPAHPELLTLMPEIVHLLGIEIEAALHIAHEGVIVPAVPEPIDHLGEFARAPIAFRMIAHLVAAKVQGFGGLS